MRRRFNSRERVALYLFSDGHCTQCGCELRAGWHADHEIPFARGGATDAANGQALCPDCNLKKGVSMTERGSDLFRWQAHAIEQFMRKLFPNFLCEATPGAGKTRVGAEIAFRLHKSREIEYVVVVVPSTHLRKQTSDAFRETTGLQLNYEWKPGLGEFPRGVFCGVVVTYNTILGNAAMFRRLCNKCPALVVLDEIHHASEKQSWGIQLHEAFELARFRVLLSGTPFRSDNGRIPFVRYVDGQGVPDVRYGYGEALADCIVREVYFPKVGGRMEWVDDDGQQAASFDDDIDEYGVSKRLRTALMAEGGVMLDMLRHAHRDLLEMREEDPNAAGLVVAIDQDHAKRIADRMRRELGVEAIIVVSDDDTSHNAIERFENSDAPWIVAVKMVSEGVDIPRLRVCVYASNTITELFFRQVVGRVVRREKDSNQHWAHVIIPDDARLRKFAAEIRSQRELILGKEKDPEGDGPSAPRAPSTFIPVSAKGEQAGAIGADLFLSPAELEHARSVKLLHRDTAGLSDVCVAILLRNTGSTWQAPPDERPSAQQDATARLHELRNTNEQTSRRIAFKVGLPFKEVNGSLNKAAGIRSVTKCFDEAKLVRRLEIATRWLNSGDLAEAMHG